MSSPKIADHLLTLLDLENVRGGMSTFTGNQLLEWCAQGKQQMPQNPELGCVANVAQNVGSQVSSDNMNTFKQALDRVLGPQREQNPSQ